MAYNKFAYQRIKSEIPFSQQVVIAILSCFLPFFLVVAMANEKAPKGADQLIGFCVLPLAVAGGMKLSSNIAKRYE
jgi:hypothetical protein